MAVSGACATIRQTSRERTDGHCGFGCPWSYDRLVFFIFSLGGEAAYFFLVEICVDNKLEVEFVDFNQTRTASFFLPQRRLLGPTSFCLSRENTAATAATPEAKAPSTPPSPLYFFLPFIVAILRKTVIIIPCDPKIYIWPTTCGGASATKHSAYNYASFGGPHFQRFQWSG